MSDKGVEGIVDLRDRWRAHNVGDGDALDTMLAVFGINSSIGRRLMKANFNAPYGLWLEDAAYDLG